MYKRQQYLTEEYSDPKSPRKGWGHSTVSMAVKVAKEARVKQLVLFHHNPEADDEKVAAKEKIAQAMFPNSIAAYEGLELEI